MTFDDVYSFLNSIITKGNIFLVEPDKIEVVSGNGRIQRHEQFDEELTQLINRYVDQPKRIVVMKNSSYNGEYDSVGLNCYMYGSNGTDIYVGRLYNDHSRIYFLSRGFYRLQGEYRVLKGEERSPEEKRFLRDCMEWLAKESSIYRLPLLVGTLTFNWKG